MDAARIQRLIDAKRLEVAEASDDEIVGLWQKALEANRDARLASLSLNGRLGRAYDAARIAASALVRAAGCRVRSASHHHDTIYTAMHLVEDDLLEQALAELEEIRGHRHAAEYGWGDTVDSEDIDSAIDVADRIINLSAKHLREARPQLKARIKMVRRGR